MAEHQQMQQPHQGQQMTAQILNVQGGVATLDEPVPVQIMMPATVVMEEHHQPQEHHQVPQHVQEMHEVVQEAVGATTQGTPPEDPKITNKKELSKQWKSLCKRAKQWCSMHDDSVPNFVMMYLDENRLVWEGPDHMESFISDESVISAFLRTAALSESLIGMEKRGADDTQDISHPAKKQKKAVDTADESQKAVDDEDDVLSAILEKREPEDQDAEQVEGAGGDEKKADVDPGLSQGTDTDQPSQSTSEGQSQGGEGDVLSQVIESVIKDWAPGQGPPPTSQDEGGDANYQYRTVNVKGKKITVAVSRNAENKACLEVTPGIPQAGKVRINLIKLEAKAHQQDKTKTKAQSSVDAVGVSKNIAGKKVSVVRQSDEQRATEFVDQGTQTHSWVVFAVGEDTAGQNVSGMHQRENKSSEPVVDRGSKAQSSVDTVGKVIAGKKVSLLSQSSVTHVNVQGRKISVPDINAEKKTGLAPGTPQAGLIHSQLKFTKVDARTYKQELDKIWMKAKTSVDVDSVGKDFAGKNVSVVGQSNESRTTGTVGHGSANIQGRSISMAVSTNAKKKACPEGTPVNPQAGFVLRQPELKLTRVDVNPQAGLGLHQPGLKLTRVDANTFKLESSVDANSVGRDTGGTKESVERLRIEQRSAELVNRGSKAQSSVDAVGVGKDIAGKKLSVVHQSHENRSAESVNQESDLNKSRTIRIMVKKVPKKSERVSSLNSTGENTVGLDKDASISGSNEPDSDFNHDLPNEPDTITDMTASSTLPSETLASSENVPSVDLPPAGPPAQGTSRGLALRRNDELDFLKVLPKQWGNIAKPTTWARPANKIDHNYCIRAKVPLRRRRQYKTRTSEVVCDVCGLAMRKSSLPSHMRIHTGEKPFKCDVCQKKFRYKDTLKKHELEHTSDPRPFKCPKCPASFTSQKYLNHHSTKSNHREESDDMKEWYEEHPKKTVLCELCPKMFTPWGIRNHMKLSHPDGVIEKENKKKQKKPAKRRKKYLKKGESGYWFLCPYCDSPYANQCGLAVHISINHKDQDLQDAFDVQPEYRGEKDDQSRLHHVYKWGYGLVKICNVCGKRVSRLKFRHHLLLHRGKEPHKCHVCDAPFLYPSSLRLHMRLHFGTKTSASVLQLKTNAKKLPYKCKTCGKILPTCAGLRKHDRRHHGLRIAAKWRPGSCVVPLPLDYKPVRMPSSSTRRGPKVGSTKYWKQDSYATESVELIQVDTDVNAPLVTIQPTEETQAVSSILLADEARSIANIVELPITDSFDTFMSQL